jgi:hypothetical protein
MFYARKKLAALVATRVVGCVAIKPLTVQYLGVIWTPPCRSRDLHAARNYIRAWRRCSPQRMGVAMTAGPVIEGHADPIDDLL